MCDSFLGIFLSKLSLTEIFENKCRYVHMCIETDKPINQCEIKHQWHDSEQTTEHTLTHCTCQKHCSPFYCNFLRL